MSFLNERKTPNDREEAFSKCAQNKETGCQLAFSSADQTHDCLDPPAQAPSFPLPQPCRSTRRTDIWGNSPGTGKRPRRNRSRSGSAAPRGEGGDQEIGPEQVRETTVTGWARGEWHTRNTPTAKGTERMMNCSRGTSTSFASTGLTLLDLRKCLIGNKKEKNRKLGW